ncbi:metallophosphoesterase family protein [Bordetella holmesii]|uniref:Calcineurin-like phosphoesterase family protein n=3 Tax=Bordetella holmesii TaxID=35814 RepID=A0A158M316_9BORD|nr:DNA repair exonuclease [Bordetella holmesii]AHV94605.1 calcineurin-like phosphoesterase family protein [Bordetella holmesii ATCC 51541]AIT28354.1 calcineurin-like phosphoesterase family protein [Bordetella holmesii 44057]EWM41144.1 calcineurin-like phosphoesterase family protein [Bordetella holmesii 35009]EWM42289.1 calcineurin-like phosphoesterase family protein [Bordetella holmesii 41130]EWM45033.1 calcineurin-like phosphoesterase family protein [Bordetella holmesii 70147]
MSSRPVSFLHTADWQIGRQYGQFDDDDGAVLAEARLETVARLAGLAHERGVDAVLVAGDVFDTQAVSDRTIRRLFAALQAYSGPWVMIPGNHDAALADSVWTRAQQLGCIPENVSVALQAGVIELPGMAVLAADLTQRHTYDDVTRVFDGLASPPGLPRVGLAHGSVAGRLPESADAANPIAADRAERARLDYLALGDWHGCLRVGERCWYAGTPAPDRFRGNEPGYVLHVRLQGGAAEVEPLKVGRYRWQAWTVALSVEADAETLAVRLEELRADDVLRLTLTGTVSLAAWERLAQVIGQAQARLRALRLDQDALTLEPQETDFAALDGGGYVGDVAARLRAMQAQSDPQGAQVARDAMRILMRMARDGSAP